MAGDLFDTDPSLADEPPEEVEDDGEDSGTDSEGDDKDDDASNERDEREDDRTSGGDEPDSGEDSGAGGDGDQDDGSDGGKGVIEEEGGKFVLKVDGEIIEKSKDELVVLAQKGLAADKRMEAAAEGVKAFKEAQIMRTETENLQKEVIGFRDQLTSNPMQLVEETLQAMGYSDVEILNRCSSYVEETKSRYDQLKENPEAFKMSAVERENERLKQESEGLRKAQKDQTESQQRAEYSKQLQTETLTALKDAEVPATEESIIDVATIILAHWDTYQKELTPAQAVSMLEDKLIERRDKNLASLSYEDLKKANPDLLEKLRKEDLAALKNRKGAMGATPPKTGASVTKPKRRKKAKAQSFTELFGEV